MRMVALAEIAAITAGQSPPGSTYNDDGRGLPFFQGKADFGEVHPTVRKWCSAPNKTAEAGDILISVRAPVGPTNIAAERCCIGRGLAAVRPDDAAALPDFVHWILKYREPELVAKARGSTFGAIAQKDLKSLKVPLPPLEEQRRIVSILNRAAKVERLRAQAREVMGEFMPSLFVRMFGDPVENSRGWDVARLDEVIQGFEAGKNVKAGNGATPFRILKVSAVTSGEFDPSMSKPAPDDHVASRQHLVRIGDLLISRANTSALVGATAMVEREAPHVLLPDKIWRFVWRTNSPVEPRFVHGLFQSQAIRKLLSEMASGTSASMKNISQAKLKTLPIIVPPLDQQMLYGELVGKTRRLYFRAGVVTSGAAALVSSLMSRLLRDGA